MYYMGMLVSCQFKQMGEKLNAIKIKWCQNRKEIINKGYRHFKIKENLETYLCMAIFFSICKSIISFFLIKKYTHIAIKIKA